MCVFFCLLGGRSPLTQWQCFTLKKSVNLQHMFCIHKLCSFDQNRAFPNAKKIRRNGVTLEASSFSIREKSLKISGHARGCEYGETWYVCLMRSCIIICDKMTLLLGRQMKMSCAVHSELVCVCVCV